MQNFDNYNDDADYGAGDQNCNAFTNTINNNNLPPDMGDPNITNLFPGIINTLNPQYFE